MHGSDNEQRERADEQSCRDDEEEPHESRREEKRRNRFVPVLTRRASASKRKTKLVHLRHFRAHPIVDKHDHGQVIFHRELTGRQNLREEFRSEQRHVDDVDLFLFEMLDEILRRHLIKPAKILLRPRERHHHSLRFRRELFRPRLRLVRLLEQVFDPLCKFRRHADHIVTETTHSDFERDDFTRKVFRIHPDFPFARLIVVPVVALLLRRIFDRNFFLPTRMRPVPDILDALKLGIATHRHVRRHDSSIRLAAKMIPWRFVLRIFVLDQEELVPLTEIRFDPADNVGRTFLRGRDCRLWIRTNLANGAIDRVTQLVAEPFAGTDDDVRSDVLQEELRRRHPGMRVARQQFVEIDSLQLCGNRSRKHGRGETGNVMSNLIEDVLMFRRLQTGSGNLYIVFSCVRCIRHPFRDHVMNETLDSFSANCFLHSCVKKCHELFSCADTLPAQIVGNTDNT